VIVGRHLHAKSNFITGILGLPQAIKQKKKLNKKHRN